MNWVWENRTWLFSGAGIALVSVVVWLIRHFYTNPPTPRRVSSIADTPPITGVSVPVVPLVQTNSHPTPIEIREHLKDLPPYQQQEAASHYAGLPVRWRMQFFGLLSVTLRVRTADYPFLKIAKRGLPVRVSGCIQSVSASGFNVELRDATIDFLDSPPHGTEGKQ